MTYENPSESFIRILALRSLIEIKLKGISEEEEKLYKENFIRLEENIESENNLLIRVLVSSNQRKKIEKSLKEMS